MAIRFTLAQADTEDLTTLVDLMEQLQHDDPWSWVFDKQQVRDVMAELLSSPTRGRVWLISDDSKSIGYIVLAFDFSLEYCGLGAWVDEFFVKREYRRKGIGAQALQFFEQEARALGVKVIHLEVNRGNPALNLYQRMGYEDHERYLMSKWIGKGDRQR